MRNTDIDNVVFPVAQRPLFYAKVNQSTKKTSFTPIAGSKALINDTTGHTLGVVSEGYRLITNEEAIEYGKKCINQLFPSVSMGNIEVFNIITPSTRSWCHIDLIHRGYEVNVWKQEIYLPYIRITNSYNTSRALKFDLGFCRKICDNGVIFESATIQFYFTHTKGSIGRDIKFEAKADQLKSLEAKFIEYMNGLTKTKIDHSYVVPLVCKALDLTFDINASNGKRQAIEKGRLQTFQRDILGLKEKYFKEIGDNAYAVFAVLTDYASNNVTQDKRKTLKINGFQKKAGQWLESFLKIYNTDNFHWPEYLSNYLPYSPEKASEKNN